SVGCGCTNVELPRRCWIRSPFFRSGIVALLAHGLVAPAMFIGYFVFFLGLIFVSAVPTLRGDFSCVWRPRPLHFRRRCVFGIIMIPLPVSRLLRADSGCLIGGLPFRRLCFFIGFAPITITLSIHYFSFAVRATALIRSGCPIGAGRFLGIHLGIFGSPCIVVDVVPAARGSVGCGCTNIELPRRCWIPSPFFRSGI
ncbi:unnamed protein product, partial [Ectocarpus sp. 13 AM-2016]